MNIYNLTISSFQSIKYHRLKDLKILYRLTIRTFTEFGLKDLLIKYLPKFTNLIIFLHNRKLIWKCVKKLKRIS